MSLRNVGEGLNYKSSYFRRHSLIFKFPLHCRILNLIIYKLKLKYEVFDNLQIRSKTGTLVIFRLNLNFEFDNL
jgi:hypothetical protein